MKVFIYFFSVSVFPFAVGTWFVQGGRHTRRSRFESQSQFKGASASTVETAFSFQTSRSIRCPKRDGGGGRRDASGMGDFGRVRRAGERVRWCKQASV